jgi:hypothetical protein
VGLKSLAAKMKPMSLKPRAQQGNWQPQRNRDFREKIADFKQATDFQISRRTLRKLTLTSTQDGVFARQFRELHFCNVR